MNFEMARIIFRPSWMNLYWKRESLYLVLGGISSGFSRGYFAKFKAFDYEPKQWVPRPEDFLTHAHWAYFAELAKMPTAVKFIAGSHFLTLVGEKD
jgi:hypothetical protein